VFPPFATSPTQHAFPFGVRLQNVSSQNPSVSNTRLTSLFVHERTVRVSALTAAGLFPHSAAAVASAEFVIVAPVGAPLSTCKSYVIVHVPHPVTPTDENVSVGSLKLSVALQHESYVKLYGAPKSVSITSVIVIPVASIPVFVTVIVYLTISFVSTVLSASLSVFVTARLGSVTLGNVI